MLQKPAADPPSGLAVLAAASQFDSFHGSQFCFSLYSVCHSRGRQTFHLCIYPFINHVLVLIELFKRKLVLSIIP